MAKNNIVNRLILSTQSKAKLWVSLFTIFLGTTLLLLATLLWTNFEDLLNGNSKKDSLGATYLTVGKQIKTSGTDAETLKFTPSEIDSIKQAPEVLAVGNITSNHFPIYAIMGGNMGFATEMPIESVPNEFIDNLPSDWMWEVGQKRVPLIVSSDFLNLYNYVFAPSQGLPQLSAKSIMTLSITLKIGRDPNSELYIGYIAGFSDRIGSVIAPKSFIEYGNNKYAANSKETTTQVVLKVKDPSNHKFKTFLDNNNYNTNGEKLKWNKVRSIVSVISTSVGILAIVILTMSIFLFMMFIELTIVKAYSNIQLLITLGYSPKKLTTTLYKYFMPYIITTIASSIISTMAIQLIAKNIAAKSNLEIASTPHFYVFIVSVLCLLLLLGFMARAIKKSIH